MSGGNYTNTSRKSTIDWSEVRDFLLADPTFLSRLPPAGFHVVDFPIGSEPVTVIDDFNTFVVTEIVFISKEDLSSGVTDGQTFSISCGLVQQDFHWNDFSFELDAEGKVVRVVLDGINHLAVSGFPITIFNSANTIAHCTVGVAGFEFGDS